MILRRWRSSSTASTRFDLERALLDHLERHRDEVLDVYALAGLIQACSSSGSLRAAKAVEAEIDRRGFTKNKSLGNHLINCYARLGCVRDAAAAFDRIGEKNVVSYNAMITAYAQNGHFDRGLVLFRRLLLLDSKMANVVSFISAIKSCRDGTLEECRWIHELVNAAGLSKSNIVVGSALVNMYAACGNPADAEGVFEQMESRNEITWSALIAAYAAVPGQALRVWEIFLAMADSGVIPNEVTFISMLSSCTVPEDLIVGRSIHEAIAEYGFGSDFVVGNALLNMYGKCGDLDRARRLFDEMIDKHDDPVAWNSLLGSYTQSRSFDLAIELFGLMQIEGVAANKVTFLAAINACSGLADMKTGKLVLDCVAECGLLEDDLIKTALVSLFGKCGYLNVAEGLLGMISIQDSVSWNSIVASYASQQGHDGDVLKGLGFILLNGLHPEDGVFVAALNACANLGALTRGKTVHYLVRESGTEISTDVFTALVNMYGKCGDLPTAKEVFNGIQERFRDALAWNALMNSYTRRGMPQEGLDLYRRMQQDGIRPRKMLFVSVLNALADLGSVYQARRVHEQIMECSLDLDSTLGTLLLNMYAKCGDLDTAWKIFEKMEISETSTWNCMLGLCIRQQQIPHQQQQIPEIEQQGDAAIKLFARMLLEGIRADRSTLQTLLSACPTLPHGKKLHGLVAELDLQLESNPGLLNALLTMYSRCGSWEISREIFDSMSSFGDQVTWNSMITACAQHGHALEAVELVRRMEQAGSSPDDVTLTVILSACSHAGLVNDAFDCFQLMLGDYGIDPRPDHFGTVVDLLCRAGKLEEAEGFVSTMPGPATSVTWRSLLGGCSSHGDLDLGRRAADRLLEMDPKQHTVYIMLSNTYCN